MSDDLKQRLAEVERERNVEKTASRLNYVIAQRRSIEIAGLQIELSQRAAQCLDLACTVDALQHETQRLREEVEALRSQVAEQEHYAEQAIEAAKRDGEREGYLHGRQDAER
jgi:hypothetical protein